MPFFDQAPQFIEKSLFNPQQQGLQNSIIQQLMGILGGQGGNNPMAQQLQHQFQTQTVPGLAERFTAANGQRSSAFQGALGSAAGNLQQDLAAQQYSQLQNLLPFGLQQNFERGIIPGQQGFLSQLLGPLLGTAGFAAGGPLGAAVGSGIGSLGSILGNMFQGNQSQGQQPQGIGQFQQFNKQPSIFDNMNRNSMFNQTSGGMFNPISRPY